MREYSGLQTDLYELTMAAGYLQTGFDARASFELFARHLPPHRNYLVAAGLDPALYFLENVRFAADEIRFLRKHPVFRSINPEFFDYLKTFRFTGDVWAMPEGSLAFPGEPLLRITAPIIEGQIMETYLLATIGYQTMIASKAARVITAAAGRRVVDFGARRAHGSHASLLAARAATIGGCAGTSNVLAGQLYGIGTFGTQAHSWVMAHDDESAAFRSFVDAFPDGAVLLLDTYNVRNAVKKILALKRPPTAVRLDSGDLIQDSRWVRQQLDRAGWTGVKIFASGDLDEFKISKLLAGGAAIDSFGVGTALSTPIEAPHLSLIYKLVEVERDGKTRSAAKFSHSKVTYPGRKQVFRQLNSKQEWASDEIAGAEETEPGEPLLVQVMRAGRRIAPSETLAKLQLRCAANLARLPQRYRRIDRSAVYPVSYSKRLRGMLEDVRRRMRAVR